MMTPEEVEALMEKERQEERRLPGQAQLDALRDALPAMKGCLDRGEPVPAECAQDVYNGLEALVRRAYYYGQVRKYHPDGAVNGLLGEKL